MEKNKISLEEVLSVIQKVLTLLGIILITIFVFPLFLKNDFLKKRLKDILNPNKVTGNAEFRESQESTKADPKIDVKIDGEWVPVQLNPELKKSPVEAVFVSKDRKTGKVEIEAKHEKVDRKNLNSNNSSKSALDHIRSGS